MFLRNIWYFALPSSALKAGDLVHRQFLGEPVLLGRTKAGEAFALKDLCPHRGIPLSKGRLIGPGETAVGETVTTDQVECPYHGWRFGADGKCAGIPSLVPGQEVDLEKIRVQRYHLSESNGNIWIYMPRDALRPGMEIEDPAIPAPVLPGISAADKPRTRDQIRFDCHVDHAVIGLMDPAHGPFVHQAWWWRQQTSIHEKAKNFAPSDLGFTMVAHQPSSNSAGYRILGGKPVTEISFKLPGIRTELITVGKHKVLALTTVTPVAEEQTEVTQTFYWTNPWLSLVKPVLLPLSKAFLRQDYKIVMEQREGLKYDPKLMLINDADTQAKWYFRLKQAWDKSLENQTEFVNPVQETTLRWRS